MRCARRSRWPISSRSFELPPRGSSSTSGEPLHWPADVEGLRNLRQEAELWSQPEPFDGGDEAPFRPEPPARPPASARQGDARLCVHALPQGRQSHKSDLALRASTLSPEMPRISGEKTGQARCARVPNRRLSRESPSAGLGVGVAKPRLG